MLRNYLKIALRSLAKQKGYTFINTIGLAVGMGVCLFLVLLNQYSYNIDTLHENSERIYRVADQIKLESGSIRDVAISPAPWGQALVDDYPEIEAYTRFMNRGRVVRYEDKILRQGITYVDAQVFEIFTYPFKFGDPTNALTRPNTIVLTAEMSDRYFNAENPVGRTLIVDEEPYEITGVLEKLDPKYSFFFNSLASFSSVDEQYYPQLNDWRSHNLYTYLLLKEDADIAALEAKFPQFIERHVDIEFVSRYTVHLQNLEDLFLGSDLIAEHGATLDVTYIYIFNALALLILIIACINFINLSTAQGLKRAREVGVRKVLGAFKAQLVFQFLAEALILSVLAVFIALTLVEFALPWFNNLTDWVVAANYFQNTFYIIAIITTVLLVTLFAGGYPAFFLSAFKPVKVLKGEDTSNGSRSLLKTGLVVTQFTIAIFLIISTASVDNQLDYLKNKDLGFEEKDVLVVGIPEGFNNEQGYGIIRDELSRIPGIVETSFGSNVPGDQSGSSRSFYPEGVFREDGLLVNYYSIDPNFVSMYKLNLSEGREFVSVLASDTTSSVIINKAAVAKFEWTDPIGKTIVTKDRDGNNEPHTVVGVLEDFHFESLHSRINPLIMWSRPADFGSLAIRIQTDDVSGLTDQILAQMNELNGGLPVFNYFLEDDILDEYDTEDVIGQMLSGFTYLTMLIACLGLLGLVSFSVINRRKEIGIRKVLGASVNSIVQSISVRFLKLVMIGFVIGAPAAYFLINLWLQSFAYNNPPGALIFIGSGVITLAIAMLTISYQSIKAATANPVDSLKNE